ncbi:MAG: hypothetical protein H0S84_01500 [Bacteroidales bacterium]|jgi:3-mercaptopyruvate sulfurtransferase SseA|nr:hypothetical protein [Bacteroidales bacterium]
MYTFFYSVIHDVENIVILAVHAVTALLFEINLYCQTGVGNAKEFIALSKILRSPHVMGYDGGYNQDC